MVATSTLDQPRPALPSRPGRSLPLTGAANDAFGRAMTYLRISLTDRCNFRCVYCMPALGHEVSTQGGASHRRRIACD